MSSYVWIIPILLFLPLLIPVIQYEYKEYLKRKKTLFPEKNIEKKILR